MSIMYEGSSLSQMRSGKSRRVSSYDRTGGNKDYFTLFPKEKLDRGISGTYG